MEFRILGPLEITEGGERIDLGGTRQQIVIATLLLSANRLVTIDRLLMAIYGEDLPPTCRSQAQISVSSLRRIFAHHNRTELITTHSQGYVIQVGTDELDSARFDDLVAAGRAARDAHRLGEAVASYRDALRLWRGAALDGMDSEWLRAAASRLDEQRITTNEERIELELGLGRHRELVGELTELVHQHPLRERLRSHLMLALYRCHRSAEALEAYRDTRHILAEELGLEPSEQLRQLEHAILRSDPALALPAESIGIAPQRRTMPSLLPTDIADFTGREECTEQIHQHLLDQDRQEAGQAVPVVVIVGKGGVGKTSLAIHAAHGMADQFADGQLFADLHGGASHPVGPMRVLERFLRVLGLPSSQIPDGLDERAEMYRTLLADQKVLVVLDDATSESQVQPLLPGSSTAAVIVTSRTRLTGIAGAIRLELDVFDPDKSLDLLARIAGTTRIRSQSEVAAGVAAACGHLPLALRIAGARLAARPHWSVQRLLDRLADETHRLDELRHGEMGIRLSISLTYDSTSEEAQRLLRRLAILDIPVFSSWLGAALLDQSLEDAEDLLDDLVSSQLIETVGNETQPYNHYRFHDLIRVFARERLAAEESPAERKAALERALGALLFLAEEAHSRYYGGDYVRLPSDAHRWPLPQEVVDVLITDPLSWYDFERSAMVAGVRQAAHAGLVELCWTLAFSATTLFESRAYLDDWEETHGVALEATRRARDIRGEAAMLYSIGSMHMGQQRYDQARQELNAAVQLFRSSGNDQGTGLVTRHLAFLDRLAGRYDDAVIRYEQSLAIFSGTGDRVASAYVLQNLAQVKLELNEIDDAKDLLSEALRLIRSASCRRVEAQVLHRIGEAHVLAGELTQAVDAFEMALAVTVDIGDSIGLAYVLQSIGVAWVRQGMLDEARKALKRALELAGTCGMRLVEARALLGLTELALTSADAEQAVILAQRASQIFQEIGAPFYEARALMLLSDAYTVLGDEDDAMTASAEAGVLRSKLCSDRHFMLGADCVPPDRGTASQVHGVLTENTSEAPDPATPMARTLLRMT